MNIGNYVINDDARFLLVPGDDDAPISIGAGNGIPHVARWANGEPKEYELDPDEFGLPIDAANFERLAAAPRD